MKDEKLIACERITFLHRLRLGYRERWKPIPLANQASRRLSKSKKNSSRPLRVVQEEGLESN